MTNSTALATARILVTRLEVIQSALDDEARGKPQTHFQSVRTRIALAITDACELQQFLTELAELTLGTGGPL